MTIKPFTLLAMLHRERAGDRESIEQFVQMGASPDPRIRAAQLVAYGTWAMLSVQQKEKTEVLICVAVCPNCERTISLTTLTEEQTLPCPGCAKQVACVSWKPPLIDSF